MPISKTCPAQNRDAGLITHPNNTVQCQNQTYAGQVHCWCVLVVLAAHLEANSIFRVPLSKNNLEPVLLTSVQRETRFHLWGLGALDTNDKMPCKAKLIDFEKQGVGNMLRMPFQDHQEPCRCM